MPHWDSRPEPGWKRFKFNQPYAKGLKRLKDEVLGKTDFDPATLYQWGTMQAMAVIEILKACEARFGKEGQDAVYDALRRVGLDIGRQVLKGTTLPEGVPDVEIASYYATVVNRIAYASLEGTRVEGKDKASFDILWCPHQDHYGAFDCRVQRYFVQGMIDAMKEHAGPGHDFQVRFDSTIPAGAPTCHFTIWRPTGREKSAWEDLTGKINEKALEISRMHHRLRGGGGRKNGHRLPR